MQALIHLLKLSCLCLIFTDSNERLMERRQSATSMHTNTHAHRHLLSLPSPPPPPPWRLSDFN